MPEDPKRIPNFTALHEWFNKLEKYSQDQAARIEELESENKELAQGKASMEEELSRLTDRSEDYDSVVTMIEDVGRGVRGMDELHELIRTQTYD